MRPPYRIPIWKQAPVLRLLPALIAGIMLQWYLQFSLYFILITMGCFLTALLLFVLLPVSTLYYVRKGQGLLLLLLIMSIACLITWLKDHRHQESWYGRQLTDISRIVVRINEPLVFKPKSVKAEAMVQEVVNGKIHHAATGKILLYFARDSIIPDLSYGEILVIDKPLQAIKNSGNLGAFNYRRYAAFQQIFHQVFLKRENWISTHRINANPFYRFLFSARFFVLDALKKYIPDDQHQLGIAEALLVGYKEDLDKDLVQAYSNTGVVHIIAISGLHLGLIYVVLLWICERVPYLKRSKHAKAIVLILFLWLFALLTGAAASVLRSAVMFTVIIVGKYYFKQSNIYNSLAVSAFLLLLYNPYLLWDVGFQLSYAAVIGIVAFQKYIYRQWYPPNKVFKWVWNMSSITIAAQLGTFPICIYYFHQFPLMFLFTNLPAVPVSTAILFAEILLLLLSAFEPLARALGWLIGQCITLLNKLILFFDGLPFSLLDFLYATIITTICWYSLVICLLAWRQQKRKQWGYLALFSSFALLVAYGQGYLQQQSQRKIIIYNINRHQAIDFIDKEKYCFVGDSVLRQPGLLRNFHLKPARVSLQAGEKKDRLPALYHKGIYYQFYQKKMIWIDHAISLQADSIPKAVDILLLSRNVDVDIKKLVLAVRPATVVFDGTNSLWKIQKWKKDCEELLLRCHSVSEQGAFVLEID
jgi:competence protein ComEC